MTNVYNRVQAVVFNASMQALCTECAPYKASTTKRHVMMCRPLKHQTSQLKTRTNARTSLQLIRCSRRARLTNVWWRRRQAAVNITVDATLTQIQWQLTVSTIHCRPTVSCVESPSSPNLHRNHRTSSQRTDKQTGNLSKVAESRRLTDLTTE